MSIAQEVFKVERIVPLLARRAIDEGEPDDVHPEVDDRGYTDPEFGPVVSVTKGKTVIVRLTRKRIEAAAPLTVVSSDTNVFTVADPADGKLPNTVDMDIKITGVESGGDLKKEKLRVQFGTGTRRSPSSRCRFGCSSPSMWTSHRIASPLTAAAQRGPPGGRHPGNHGKSAIDLGTLWNQHRGARHR